MRDTLIEDLLYLAVNGKKWIKSIRKNFLIETPLVSSIEYQIIPETAVKDARKIRSQVPW